MKKWIITLVIGIFLSFGPIWGFLGTVFGMTQAFSHLAEPQPDVGALANDISLSLYTTAAGYIMCPIGIVLVILSAIRLSKPKKQKQAEEVA